MAATRYEWTAFDYATALTIFEMVTEAHYTYRDVVRLSNGQLKYNRVRDLLNAYSAPARMSEFTLICTITGNSPIEQYAKVCQHSINLRNGREQIEFTNKVAWESKNPSIEELSRPPVINDPLVSEFTKAREDSTLQIRAVHN